MNNVTVTSLNTSQNTDDHEGHVPNIDVASVVRSPQGREKFIRLT